MISDPSLGPASLWLFHADFGVSGVLGFCLMPTPQGVTMSSKSSVSHAASFVSQVMMSDSRRHLGLDWNVQAAVLKRFTAERDSYLPECE